MTLAQDCENVLWDTNADPGLLVRRAKLKQGRLSVSGERTDIFNGNSFITPEGFSSGFVKMSCATQVRQDSWSERLSQNKGIYQRPAFVPDKDFFSGGGKSCP